MAEPSASEPGSSREQPWMSPGVAGIGTASFFADVGHEVPTALLPSLLTSTLGAPAAALGLIEGIADGLAGVGRLAGGALADDPQRRRAVAVGGYTITAVLSSLLGVAANVWQAGALRAGAWFARGLRVPSRNALLADLVPANAYGRAYGFERAMDNLGAIGGPLLALGLVAVFSVRTAILVSVVPGILAALAIVYAIHRAAQPVVRERAPIRLRIRPVLHGDLGRLLGAITAFEVGNAAATLLILRATQQLAPVHGTRTATGIALGLYIAYNIAATMASVPAGHASDRLGTRGPVLVMSAGITLFGLAYAALAVNTTSYLLLALPFGAAGLAVGCVETAEHAAVAALAPSELRGSAFGLLATVQALGNFAASAVAGLLWTFVSPNAAWAYLSAWMAVALVGMLLIRPRHGVG
ncbi:MFS transporter [Microtetraspora sp. AC03309]|uniref:MFS transporter n=1 Tax=Microtetraspora sp. AC03309 TaxID=2779376 RepID=UPI001E4BD18D|nr:MFS transporter [Microtetraspora sp. AC03309]